MALSVVALTVCAQVTIGAGTPPHDFSVLELISNGKMGLRMPMLTTSDRNDMTNSAEFQAVKATLARGLTIFNTTSDCLEFWNGAEWISMCTDTTPPCSVPDPASVSPSTETPVSATINTDFTLGAVSVSYTSGSPTTKYQWYRNTTKSTTGAILLTGKTSNSLTTQESTAGTYYYY
jgi:hypothetical protein